MTETELKLLYRFAPAEVAPWKLFPKLVRFGRDSGSDDADEIWILASMPANDHHSEDDIEFN